MCKIYYLKIEPQHSLSLAKKPARHRQNMEFSIRTSLKMISKGLFPAAFENYETATNNGKTSITEILTKKIARRCIIDEASVRVMVQAYLINWIKSSIDEHFVLARSLILAQTTEAKNDIQDALTWNQPAGVLKYLMQNFYCLMELDEINAAATVVEAILDNLPTINKAPITRQLKIFAHNRLRFYLAQLKTSLAAETAKMIITLSARP